MGRKLVATLFPALGTAGARIRAVAAPLQVVGRDSQQTRLTLIYAEIAAIMSKSRLAMLRSAPQQQASAAEQELLALQCYSRDLEAEQDANELALRQAEEEVAELEGRLFQAQQAFTAEMHSLQELSASLLNDEQRARRLLAEERYEQCRVENELAVALQRLRAKGEDQAFRGRLEAENRYLRAENELLARRVAECVQRLQASSRTGG